MSECLVPQSHRGTIVPITDEEFEKFRREWEANHARQRLQESIRRLRAGEFTVELMRAEDEPKEGELAFQQQLSHFSQTLRTTGASYSQTAFAMDAVDSQGFPLPEFVIAIKTLAPPVITAVAGYATAWVQGRMGRKMRIRIGDVEAEGRTLAEIEALLRMATEYQDRTSAGGEKEVSVRRTTS